MKRAALALATVAAACGAPGPAPLRAIARMQRLRFLLGSVEQTQVDGTALARAGFHHVPAGPPTFEHMLATVVDR